MLDKWFQTQALSTRDDTLAAVKALAEHPSFTLANPNRVVRKLWGTREALAALDLPPVLPVTFADVADLGRLVPADAPHQGLVAEVEPLEDMWLGDLLIEGKADAKGTLLFGFELTYAGIFRLQNVPKDTIEPIMLIECPRLLFPFAREIVSAAVRNGGFPPLMIDPVDFVGLYRQKVAQAQAASATKS